MKPPPIHEQWVTSDGKKITIRPITPEDREIEQAFVTGLSENSRYFRFFSAIKGLSPRMLDRFTNVDFPRELALIATVREKTEEIEVGVARYAPGSTDDTVEFAVVVADDWQNQGIGRNLLRHLINEAESAHFGFMEGVVLKVNKNMLLFCKHLGFSERQDVDDAGLVWVKKTLHRND